jgi:uncharacterized protein YabN with tetrapyrrole methylase and pyrophosphatase domain
MTTETKDEPTAKKGGAGVSLLDGLDRNIPSLRRALLMQQRCARVGFDWNDASGARDKLLEELRELDEAVSKPEDREAVRWEMGDLLLAATNLARLLGVDCEAALHEALDRFARRFRTIEEKLARAGLRPEDVSLDELEEHWQSAKREE